MRATLWIYLSLLAADLPAQDTPDVKKFVDKMRTAALAYESRLPDFVCIQTSQREERLDAPLSANGPGLLGPALEWLQTKWNTLYFIEEQLTYSGHRDNYRSVAPGPAAEVGLIRNSQFGGTLRGLFRSRATLRWLRADTLRGTAVFVLSYEVGREDSGANISARGQTVTTGYHGLLFADRETGEVSRLTSDAEVPADFPMQQVTRLLDFQRVEFGGKGYTVPLHGESEFRTTQSFVESGRIALGSPQVRMRNTADFKLYEPFPAGPALRLPQE